MADYTLALGFAWDSVQLPGSSVYSLQVCLTTGNRDNPEPVSFYLLPQNSSLEVLLVNLSGGDADHRGVSTILTFDKAWRSEYDHRTPFDDPYLATVLGETDWGDFPQFAVKNAPHWFVQERQLLQLGTFTFSSLALVYHPESQGLRTFVVDPEMQVGPDDGGQVGYEGPDEP